MDAEAFRTVWSNRSSRMGAGIDQALTELAPLIQAVSRYQMNRLIYSKPPDVDASGRPKWVQTRNLYNAEQAEVDRSTKRVVLVNRLIYARPRHELGRDGRQTTRIAHWRDEARDTLHRTFLGKLRAANLSALGGDSREGPALFGIRLFEQPDAPGSGGSGGGGGGTAPTAPRIPVPRRKKLRYIRGRRR